MKKVEQKKKRKSLRNNRLMRIILPDSFSKWKITMTKHYLVK
jgi:hypothetical protein